MVHFRRVIPLGTIKSIHHLFLLYGWHPWTAALAARLLGSSVAMAHEYAKIEGRPMMSLLHGTGGLQIASSQRLVCRLW